MIFSRKKFVRKQNFLTDQVLEPNYKPIRFLKPDRLRRSKHILPPSDRPGGSSAARPGAEKPAKLPKLASALLL